MQPIRVSIREAKQPIRAQEVLKFWCAISKRTLIGPTPAGILNRENKAENQKC